MSISPLMINIGLHYHCCPTDFRDLDAVAIKQAIEFFVKAGLIEKTPEREATPSRQYRATPGLEIWVNALCNVPLPERKWCMPHYEGGWSE